MFSCLWLSFCGLYFKEFKLDCACSWGLSQFRTGSSSCVYSLFPTLHPFNEWADENVSLVFLDFSSCEIKTHQVRKRHSYFYREVFLIRVFCLVPTCWAMTSAASVGSWHWLMISQISWSLSRKLIPSVVKARKESFAGWSCKGKYKFSIVHIQGKSRIKC